VEDLLLAQQAQEGGVAFMQYLLNKAVLPGSTDVTAPIREWTYKDIL
jgi:hypothetical protein